MPHTAPTTAAAIADALAESGLIDLSHDGDATEVTFAQRAASALGTLMPAIAARLTHHAAEMATDEAARDAAADADCMASVLSARIATAPGLITFERWQAARYAVPSLAAAPALALYDQHVAGPLCTPDRGGFIYPLGSLSDGAMWLARTATGFEFDAGGCILSALTLEAAERLLWLNWAADCVGDQLSLAAAESLSEAPDAREINSRPLYLFV